MSALINRGSSESRKHFWKNMHPDSQCQIMSKQSDYMEGNRSHNIEVKTLQTLERERS
jgi:hypothetical protein